MILEVPVLSFILFYLTDSYYKKIIIVKIVLHKKLTFTIQVATKMFVKCELNYFSAWLFNLFICYC